MRQQANACPRCGTRSYLMSVENFCESCGHGDEGHSGEYAGADDLRISGINNTPQEVYYESRHL